MRPLILTATGLFLAGCVSNPGVDTLNPAERESFKRIQILDNNVDQPHEVIARVKGKECHTTAEQSRRRTSGDAITVLKVKAVRLGADAITNAQCDRHMTIDWRSDCWSSMLCVADAVKFQ